MARAPSGVNPKKLRADSLDIVLAEDPEVSSYTRGLDTAGTNYVLDLVDGNAQAAGDFTDGGNKTNSGCHDMVPKGLAATSVLTAPYNVGRLPFQKADDIFQAKPRSLIHNGD